MFDIFGIVTIYGLFVNFGALLLMFCILMINLDLGLRGLFVRRLIVWV